MAGGGGVEETFSILKEMSLWSSPQLNLSVGGWHTQKKTILYKRNDTENELPHKKDDEYAPVDVRLQTESYLIVITFSRLLRSSINTKR